MKSPLKSATVAGNRPLRCVSPECDLGRSPNAAVGAAIGNRSGGGAGPVGTEGVVRAVDVELELHLPVAYGADRGTAERILLDVARRHTNEIVREATPSIAKLMEEYRLATAPEIEPHSYLRLSEKWVELSVRFITPIEGGRGLVDAMPVRGLHGGSHRGAPPVASPPTR